MALSFLRHLKPETLKSRKKLPAAAETPLRTNTAQRRLNDESPANDPITDQYVTVVDGQQRAEEEEKESGISCTDSSSELSRRESDDSQDTDPEVASSLSTIEDLEGCRTEIPVEGNTVLSEGRLEDAASDLSASDVPESSAGTEEVSQNEALSSYVDADAGSVGRPSEYPEHPLEESLQHHSEEVTEDSEAEVTDDYVCSAPTSYPLLYEELVSETESRSPPVQTHSSSTYQSRDDRTDDAESYLSTTSRHDSVMDPDAHRHSQGSRISWSEDAAPSLHSPESSEISVDTITEFSTMPPPLPPPAPPPPPPLGLFLPGDHTTSSTTDVLPISTSVSAQDVNAAAGVVRDEETEDELMRQIKAAARKMSTNRDTLSHLDQGSLPTNAKPTKFSESFTSDLKSVIASRQSRIESSPVDGGDIPGKITFYKSRIGIPPEDTELCRVFLKRAAKSGTLEHPRDGGFAEERPTLCKEVLTSGATAPPITTNDNRNSSTEDTKQFNVTSFDENNIDASITSEDTEHSTSAVVDEVNACTVSTPIYEEIDDTQQNVTEDMSWQNESGDTPDHFSSAPVENSDFEQGAEFDKVVEDFDQFLEENTFADSWRESSEAPPPLQDQIQSPPVFEPSDVKFRNGHVGSSRSEFTNVTSENSSSFSPNLSTFSEAESPVFEEMDDVAISTSAQTVQERSKLLAQPLESYNILPISSTNENISTKIEPKSRFSFRNIMASLRNTLGRRKQDNSEEGKAFSIGDGSQMKFDDNWSIHDTITQRGGHTLEDRNKNKSRSLSDVFINCDVKSLSEYTDPDKNSGKDFSVRNWKEVMERSNVSSQSTFASPDQGHPEIDSETAGFMGLLTKRSISSPNLGSPGDTKYFSQTEKAQSSAKSSRAAKKQRSSTSKMEELTTSMESSSRQASSSLNSTLPSRHLHGMMQSFGSIYPGSQTLGQKHYRKKSEPRQYSLPSKGTAGLLSPVQRRKQRSQQAKK